MAIMSTLLAPNTTLAADWSLTHTTDPVSGDERVSVGRSADTTSGQRYSFIDDPYMVVRCTKKGSFLSRRDLEVYIHWDDYISDYQNGNRVTYRFGSEAQKSELSNLSTTNQSTFFRQPDSVVEGMIRAAKSDTKTFAAAVTPYNENRYVGTWRLDTFMTDVRPVLRHCHVGHWLPPKEVFKGEVQTTSTDREGWLVATFEPSTYLLKVALSTQSIRIFKVEDDESYTLVYNGTFADNGLDEQGWLVLDLKQEGLAPHVVLYKSGTLRLFEAW